MQRRHCTLALTVTVTALALSAVAATSHAEPKQAAGNTRGKNGTTVVGSKGAIWQIAEGAQLRAQPGSELRLLGRPQLVQIDAGPPRPVYTVILRRGRIDIDIPKSARSAVAVAAPRRVTVLVRRGTAAVKASAAQVAMANFNGDTAAAVGGSLNFKTVARGAIRRVDGSGATDSPLLKPPSQLAGRRVFMSSGKPVTLESFSWQPQSGAAGYVLELLRESERKPLLSIETREPSVARPEIALEPGKYRVIVKAVDELGFHSATALESSLNVVSASLPGGAYFDSTGRIRMVPGSRVALTHAEGLEISDGQGSALKQALLGIDGEDAITLFLGSRGGKDRLPLRFGPRTVRARIGFTPALATWPQDPVEIVIELVDPSGQPVPDGLQMQPKVTVGLEPVSLDFQRKGHTLRATLPAWRGNGPWVVRVEVTDQFGLPLGRDLLEISPTPRR